MNKSIFCIAALILAAPAFADETRCHTTRDSGSYEASLRLAGVPLSGGMAWGGRGETPEMTAAILLARSKDAARTVAVATPKKAG